MYNFDSYNVLLSIATNIPVLLMAAFVLQGHKYENTEKFNIISCSLKALINCSVLTQTQSPAIHTSVRAIKNINQFVIFFNITVIFFVLRVLVI